MVFDQYREVGDFLRARRARIDPEEVGLPASPRRRARGLLREEVGLLANVSPAWYSRLEQGHKVHPSREVLDNLAEALRLSDVERRYLAALRNDAPAHSVLSPEARRDSVELVRRLVESHSAAELPVYAIDEKYDLIGWNPATARWYADFDRRTGLGRNLAGWMFTDPMAREVLSDWSTCARHLVAAIRFAIGTNHLELDRVPAVALLRAADPDFARWWETHDVAEPGIETRAFEHPRAGRCTMTLLSVRPSVATTFSIVHHLGG